MSFALVRLDDRLLHGQVVYGWGRELRPACYLIVDDAVAEDPWERAAYEATETGGAAVEIAAVAAFAGEWRRWAEHSATVLLLRRPPTLAALWAGGFRPEQDVNLGGLHGEAGSREILPYVHLLPGEAEQLRQLAQAGCRFFAQDVPQGASIGHAALLARLQPPARRREAGD